LLDFARLCRRCRPAWPPKWRKTLASAGAEGEIRRETDCLLEGAGFELPVPEFSRAFFTPLRSVEPQGAREPQPGFDDRQRQVYRAPSQAGPGSAMFWRFPYAQIPARKRNTH